MQRSVAEPYSFKPEGPIAYNLKESGYLHPKVAVDSAVGNISSLQEGLRMKREQCEESSMVSNPGGISRSGSNLLKAGDLISEEDKARKQFYFSEIKRRYQVGLFTVNRF